MKHLALIGCGIVLSLLLIAAAPVAALTSTTLPNDSVSSMTVSPAAGSAGTTVEVLISGGNFTSTSGSVRLEKSGEDEIDGRVLSWATTQSQIDCSFKIPKSSTTGKWNVVVIKGYDSTALVLANGFTVSQAMTLTSVSPTSGRAGRDIDYTITGSGLSDVAKVYLYNKNYDNITDTSPDAADTKVKGTFDLTDADEATYQVCVVDIYKAVKCGLEFDVGTNKKGSIDISSSPSGATIYLDDIANGTTPRTLDDVIVGSHKIVLRKSGYEDWGKTVTVTDGDTTNVDAKLYAVQTATPVQTTNAPVYTTMPVTTRTTIKSTLKIPTTYADVPTAATTSSPLDPLIVIGATSLVLGAVVLRRR